MTDAPDRAEGDAAILVFDGACNLCNGFVRFLLARDHARRFRFAASQSRFGASAMRDHGIDPADPSSLLLLRRRGALLRSDAALAAVGALGGGWRLVVLLRVIPRPIRDAAYRFVARNRYRWFGTASHCDACQPAADPRFLS